MLELLELLARGLFGLVRLLSILEHLVYFFLGARWLVSAGFREKVRGYETFNRFSVYFGATTIVLLATGMVIYLAFG
jgi:hypothetical protein